MKKLGQFINNYIKSYGTSWIYKPPIIVWPRKKIVKYLCTIIAQIDEEEYRNVRNTQVYR